MARIFPPLMPTYAPPFASTMLKVPIPVPADFGRELEPPPAAPADAGVPPDAGPPG